MVGLILYVLISLLIGGVICFCGKKLFFPVVRVLIFITAFNSCLLWLGFNWKSMLIALAVTVLAMMLIHFFHKLSMLFIGGICGATIGALAASFLPADMAGYRWIIIAICALIGGICCMIWRNRLLMLSTAYAGAFIIAVPVCFLIFKFNNLQNYILADGVLSTMLHLDTYLNNDFLSQNTIVILIATLIFTVLGFFYQSKAESAK